MAKKSKESGPGVFMILTLVFFVLATIILGLTTYLGFTGQEELQTAAKTDKDAKLTVEKNLRETQAKLYVNRIAIGTDTAEDREGVSGLAKEQGANILAEHQLVTSKLGGAAVPPGAAFTWILDGDKPAVAPKQNLGAIAKMWHSMYGVERGKAREADRARKDAEGAKQTALEDKEAAKKDFDAKVLALTEQVRQKTDAMTKAFQDLKTEADKKGLEFKKAADEYAEARAKLDEALAAEKKDHESTRGKLVRAMNPDPSDLEAKWRHFNPAKVAEAMGSVSDKSGEFVTLTFGKKMNLVPGQTFVVIAAGTSLIAVIDREKALDKHHYEFASLGPRDPFDKNEMVKGMVEVTDATRGGGYTAQARITHQAENIRNPIGKGDQIFNLTLSSGAKEHVAYCGIIDLDGDGRPNNEEFVRILEKNNLVVDEYLDLKTGEIKKLGGGMDTRTKFLIVGTDAPLVGGVKTMIEAAKKNGVMLIDARVFLHLIGVKPPKAPAAPAYTTVNLGGEGAAAPKDGEVPMPPVVDPKKEEPKKEEPKKEDKN